MVNSGQPLAARPGIKEMSSGGVQLGWIACSHMAQELELRTQDESILSAYLPLLYVCHYTLPALYTLTDYEFTFVVRLERHLFYVVNKYCKTLVLLKD